MESKFQIIHNLRHLPNEELVEILDFWNYILKGLLKI